MHLTGLIPRLRIFIPTLRIGIGLADIVRILIPVSVCLASLIPRLRTLIPRLRNRDVHSQTEDARTFAWVAKDRINGYF